MISRGLKGDEEANTIGPAYLIRFADHNLNFRWAEFQAAAEYYNIRYCFVPIPGATISYLEHLNSQKQADGTAKAELQDHAESSKTAQSHEACSLDSDRSFALVHLANDEDARNMAKRATCILAISQYWASGNTKEELLEKVRDDESIRQLWLPFRKSEIVWRASFTSHRRSLPIPEQLKIIEIFSQVFQFPGPIRLRNPDLDWMYAEEWTDPRNLNEKNFDGDHEDSQATQTVEENGKPFKQRLVALHIGRKVCEGVARDLIGRMDVKKRAYIGTTTMESSVSLIQACMALAGPGKLIYDPFAGTGSLLLAAAAYGSYVLASDIDARMIRGKSTKDGSIGVLRSAKQYGTEHLFIDSLCVDITQHPLRTGGLFDAIVADPPYGIRAGAKKLGKKNAEKMRTEPFRLPNGNFSHEQSDYHPPNQPYALDELLCDLMAFGAKMLKPKGRLVFWMPTMTVIEQEDGEEQTMAHVDLQLPPTKYFNLIAHSMQDFNNWGRRLITLERVDGELQEEIQLVLPAPPLSHIQAAKAGLDSADMQKQNETGKAIDGLSVFRDKYFKTLGRARREAQLLT